MPIDWIGGCFSAQVRRAVNGLERRATSVVLAGSPKTGCDSESDNDTTQPSVSSPLPSVFSAYVNLIEVNLSHGS
jgi:hypothetical protein